MISAVGLPEWMENIIHFLYDNDDGVLREYQVVSSNSCKVISVAKYIIMLR